MGKEGMRTDHYSPSGEPKTDSMSAKRVTAGVEHFDNKEPFVLSRCPYKPPKPRGRKTPDVLVFKYDKAWSAMRTEELGRLVYYFEVFNETRGSSYTTETFEGVYGEPCANCNCPSSTPCKHILGAVLETLKINPQFGENEKGCEFMVGLKLAPPGTEVGF